MSKAQHTPGPWEAGFLDQNHFPYVFIGPHLRYIDNSGNGFRAKITINEGPTPEDVEKGRGFGTTMETCRANARLIAAAPECLEELEKSNWMLSGLLVFVTDTALRQKIEAQLKDNRAAIAKAKGE